MDKGGGGGGAKTPTTNDNDIASNAVLVSAASVSAAPFSDSLSCLRKNRSCGTTGATCGNESSTGGGPICGREFDDMPDTFGVVLICDTLT